MIYIMLIYIKKRLIFMNEIFMMIDCKYNGGYRVEMNEKMSLIQFRSLYSLK